MEEARHQVLRRQEATQEEVQLPEEDRLRGRDVRGVPRRRRGRRGQDQVRAHIQHQVVIGRQLEVSMLRVRR